MSKNPTPQVIACPLLDTRQGLKREDRLCHIPETRAFYLAVHPGRICHPYGKCHVCAVLPKEVAEEIRRHAQKTRDKENQRISAAIRAFIEKKSSASQANSRLPSMAT
ncbi:MAG: hypothetical protein KBB51_02425 [Candidatus Moranbacteria bacterium]|nr:hypothetical protein [Candidatus Moranbacteria bacterium]